MNNIKAKSYIEFTKDGITEKFYEGDNVICRTTDKEYTGTITCVGEFKENEDAESVTVICLDTSKSVWSHSSEIIKFDDIEFMCKDFLADTDINSDISDEETKKKLKNKEELKVPDLVKNPIRIKNKVGYNEISEKVLQKLILEDIPSFLKELGNGFSFIDNEYKIKIGDRYNYIDLLLFNIEHNCYVVVELKVTELKKRTYRASRILYELYR